jgi:hypothetical protein
LLIAHACPKAGCSQDWPPYKTHSPIITIGRQLTPVPMTVILIGILIGSATSIA